MTPEPERESVSFAFLRLSPRFLVVRISLILLATSIAGIWAWRGFRSAALWSQAQGAAKEGDWALTEQALGGMAWYGTLPAEAQRLRIQAATKRGERAVAARLLEQVQGNPAQVIGALVERGRILLELDRLREAEETYHRILEIQPTNSSARKALIGILGLQRRGTEQEYQLWTLFEQARSRPAARVEALCLLARGGPVIPADTLPREVDEGMVLERGLKADPDNPHIRAALAFFLRNRGHHAEAEQILERGDKAPEGEEYLALLLDLGRIDVVGRLLNLPDRSAPPTTAPSPRRSLLRGIWLTMQGKPGEAVESFQEAIKGDPRNPEAHHRLAQALRAAGHPEEAAPHLDWVEDARSLQQLISGINYSSANPAVLARAAELCRKMGRNREADSWESLAAPGAEPAPPFLRP
jgi:tetratricopeptide (TPR) repeat protein